PNPTGIRPYAGHFPSLSRAGCPVAAARKSVVPSALKRLRVTRDLVSSEARTFPSVVENTAAFHVPCAWRPAIKNALPSGECESVSIRPETCSPSLICSSIRGGASRQAQRCQVILPLPAIGSFIGPIPQQSRL